MKIYFAGSIRGGRNDKELYFKIIDYLRKYGQVLTEHIGDLDLTETGEDGPNDEWIYKRDMTWLMEANVLIAEVSTPSLGVGYEIAYAEKFNKKILCLYHEQTDKRLSAMISGNYSLKVKKYKSIEDAKKYIDDFLR
ncbi:MAG: nucleoside 2-deoxyribosyltransferase [Chlorobi bacterium]|nr:nucleoside 2-deoxyribosyltransferase [Chlorobiota bacterium]